MPQRINRRDAFRAGGWMAALGFAPLPASAAKTAGPAIYTRIGYTPFINLTATYTINGGALTLPEVKQAMDEASHYPVNLDELMEKVGVRLAELLGAESAMVASGCAAALTHATSGCVAGTDPEKMAQLPDLTGLKNEVIIPRQSRNAYDHAFRTVGVKMIEVATVEELARSVGAKTAMIAMLGTGDAKGPLPLERLAEVGKKHKIPITVDAAAELPVLPNPYLSRGADLVAYSGGKSLRGPQCAGLLLGRKDLIKAAWANSSPHHTFGRALKVGKEEIMGMLAAIEVWKQKGYSLEADYKMWREWLGQIGEVIGKVEGVTTELRPPLGASPFPVLSLAWDSKRIGYTAGEIGHQLLSGTPRIMSHAEGEGHTFVIRPVAMKAGEAKVVAKRLEEILRGAPKGKASKPAAAPAGKVAGNWAIELEFSSGQSRHKATLTASGNTVGGQYTARLGSGEIKGTMDGDTVRFRTGFRYEGNTLSYEFSGKLAGNQITGTAALGEYGTARFTATRA